MAEDQTARARDGRIDIPVKIVLTESAVNRLLTGNKRIGRVWTVENSDEYGFTSSSVNPTNLQAMILSRYVSKIEFSRVDLLTYKNQVIDLTKLIVFSLLYMKFDKEFHHAIYDSETVRRWNRMNPGKIVDERTRINDETVTKYLRAHRNEYARLHYDIINPALKLIRADSNLEIQERRVQEHLSNRYLRAVSRKAWYLFLTLCSGAERDALVRSIQSTLINYVNKSQVGEYLALLIVELMMHAEYANMLRTANEMTGGPVTIEQLITEETLRSSVIEEMEKKGQELYLTWNISGRSSAVERQQKLSVSLFNREWEFESVKSEINSKLVRNLSERDLKSFFREAAVATFDTSLGLNYLAYLNDACKDLDLYFDSTVSRIPKLELTMITLLMQF